MLVDYHLHLEEGPYSFRWLDRTNQAIMHFEPNGVLRHGKQWMEKQLERVHNRIQKGCYHDEWLELYLQKALSLGLQEVGIVDHLYRFKETRNYYMKHMHISENDELGRLQLKWLNQVMTESIETFIQAIERAKPHWARHGILLKLGIEADYFVGGEKELQQLLAPYPWDYVIGSVHFINGWGFDNPETQDRFHQMNLLELYSTFFDTVEESIRSGLFDFVAHLDNIKVFNYWPEDRSVLIPLYERIANALIETNTATEVNSGLYYRYPAKEMCPGPEFLKILAEKGVVFTTSSDAHFPDDLGKYVNENKERLLQLGIRTLATFQQRKRIDVII